MWVGNNLYTQDGCLIGRVWNEGAFWYWSSGPHQGQHTTEAAARAGLEAFADS